MSNRRPTNEKLFEQNFDNIEWGESTWKPAITKPKKRLYYIMPDIEPYQAVAGKEAGTMITSRSKEREYLKRNNCIQVGNEKEFFFKYNGKTHDNPTRDW